MTRTIGLSRYIGEMIFRMETKQIVKFMVGNSMMEFFSEKFGDDCERPLSHVIRSIDGIGVVYGTPGAIDLASLSQDVNELLKIFEHNVNQLAADIVIFYVDSPFDTLLERHVIFGSHLFVATNLQMYARILAYDRLAPNHLVFVLQPSLDDPLNLGINVVQDTLTEADVGDNKTESDHDMSLPKIAFNSFFKLEHLIAMICNKLIF
jgi:hypothetical protein